MWAFSKNDFALDCLLANTNSAPRFIARDRAERLAGPSSKLSRVFMGFVVGEKAKRSLLFFRIS